MILWTVGLLVGFLLATLASGFFSGAEMGVYALNSVRVRVDADRQQRAAQRLLRLIERYETLVITTLVGTNIADYLATACITALMLSLTAGAGSAEFYATLIVTPAILVFGNILPKERFRRESYRLMSAFALPLTISGRLVRATGLLYVLTQLSRTLIRKLNPEQYDEHNLLPRTRVMNLLREGAERGGLTAFQRDTLERVMSLSQTGVGRVMIPRQRAALVPETISREAFLRVARMAHFSRFPVYRSNPRHVVGLINTFDVLTDDEQRPLTEHIQPIVTLPATKTVPAALKILQNKRQVMAVVLNAREECVGVLTVKDLVEEVVGELAVW